jgi:hypothetical protein
MRNRKLDLQGAAGQLAYIPSKVVVYKLSEQVFGSASRVPTEHATLHEPAIVPLIYATPAGNMAKVYYNGGVWWADADDLYEVEKK